jgi:hypothetical protein
MTLYYLLLLAIPFHNDPRLGMILLEAGPLIVTPVKILGLLAMTTAWLVPQPEASVPRLRNPLLLLFVPFAVIPIIVTYALGLPADGHQIGQLISAALLFAVTRPLVSTRDRVVETIRALVIAFAFSGLWVYREYFIQHVSPASGVEGESNYEAVALLLSLPMAFWMARYEQSRHWRLLGLGCGLLLAGAVVLTESRAGIIAGGTMGLLAAIVTKRKLLGFALLAIAILTVSHYGPAGLSQRFHSIQFTGNPHNGDEDSTRIHVELVKAGLHMMERHPLTGVGMGQFKAVAPTYNPELFHLSNHSYIAHDTLVQIGSECGVPVLLLFLAMLLVTLHNLQAGRRSLDPSLSALCLSMQIALIGLCVATLSVTGELFPYFVLIVLSQNLREIALPQVDAVTCFYSPQAFTSQPRPNTGLGIENRTPVIAIL